MAIRFHTAFGERLSVHSGAVLCPKPWRVIRFAVQACCFA